MKKSIKILSLLLILAAAVYFNNTFFLPSYNESSLYGSFEAKLERANSIQNEKFIIIGGSSSNLGFDSEYFEVLSGKPAVNLAVSAGVPLRVYMKAAEECASNGDVVIMPLEYGYYSADFYTVDEAYVDVTFVDGNLKCKEDLEGSIDYFCCSFLRSFTRLNDVLLFNLKKAIGISNTIYVADSVNSYGDFVLHENREPTYKRTMADWSFEYDPQVLKEIYAFIQRLEAKNVSVYITYPAYDINLIKNSDDYSSDVQNVLKSYFSESNIIGTPEQFSYDEDFFFDTPYHIQYENRKLHTQNLFDCYQNAIQTAE